MGAEAADSNQSGSDAEEDEGGESGNECKCTHRNSGSGQDSGLVEQLTEHCSAHARFLPVAGNEEASGGADEESRDLADHSFTNAEHGVCGEDGRDVAFSPSEAEDESANDVNDDDEEASDGVAFDEFGGSIHGSVEIGFAFDFFSALAGLVFVNESGCKVGVNCHLFPGHCIEGEPSDDFGDSG